MPTVIARFERTLTAADAKRNIPFAFDVPAGATQLHVCLVFSPWIVDEIHNMLTLSLFGPGGWRGSGHRHGAQHDVTISAGGATPGYLAGPVQPGHWQVVVDTHMIMPGAPCPITLEADVSSEPIDAVQPVRAPGSPAPRGPGWYRGDLHAHTIHSDASWDVPDLVAWARARGLDFVTLSDHNTVSALPQMMTCADDRLLTMGGMELTTFWGHCLALGVREWLDWRVSDDPTKPYPAPPRRAMPQIAAEVEAAGGLFIIAHPMAVGDPFCTGCQWRYADMRPGPARAVEVWNTAWHSESRNELGLALAYEWLNAGYRMALTAGTDNHGRHGANAHLGFNHVYADELSEAAILRAVRAGHNYISAGPVLELTANAGTRRAMMGDVLDAAGGTVEITARWAAGPPGAELCLIVDGKPLHRAPAAGSGAQIWPLRAGDARWCLLTLRAVDGLMLALTNPVFISRQLTVVSSQ